MPARADFLYAIRQFVNVWFSNRLFGVKCFRAVSIKTAYRKYTAMSESIRLIA